MEGYDANGHYNGGLVVSVKENQENVYPAPCLRQLMPPTGGWVEGTDYTIDYQVTGADGVNRKAEMGTANYLGNTACLFVSGPGTMKVTLTPIGDRRRNMWRQR
ncbi:MAG: hypothetical protein V8S97_02565 [Oscillospiraceae bacterium]